LKVERCQGSWADGLTHDLNHLCPGGVIARAGRRAEFLFER
jgi:hypothetical protein